MKRAFTLIELIFVIVI
ncbi:MAG: prepilin-type N-terminal cleavage/methylation domain-containing protein, partial [Epsilonproteobacteria bacterium]|nr:prepilin-type N-terminal cleavage/methylation domain-containing protein [Campylobacterota bacterium]